MTLRPTTPSLVQNHILSRLVFDGWTILRRNDAFSLLDKRQVYRRRVGTTTFVLLLDNGWIERAPEAPGEYRITQAGRMALRASEAAEARGGE